MKKILLVILFLSVLFAMYSHAVFCDTSSGGVTLKAYYESGKPMANAQVRIFSPSDYTKPFIIDKTNKVGVYSFIPDKDGEWIVMIRDGQGHGVRKNITISKNSIKNNRSSSFNLLQKILITLSIVWGLIGTALFFKRRK